jgi:hypothetical protein
LRHTDLAAENTFAHSSYSVNRCREGHTDESAPLGS